MKGVVFAGTLLAGLMLASTAQAANPVVLTTEAAAELSPNDYVWQDTSDGQAVSVIVSIPDQRAYVYRGEALIAVSTVSTGKQGKDTPVGIYPILQKNKDHKSNLYNSAPMPFMQRLTWDGIALHAGANPGFPASHGCVRLPTAFAKALFAVTQVGTTVEVVDYSVDGATPALPPSPERVATAHANGQQLAALERR